MVGTIFRLVRRGVVDLFVHFWANLFTLVAVTLASFLAGFILLVLHNVNLELVKSRGEVQFQVYFSPAAPDAAVREELEQLKQLDHLKSWEFFTPAEALDELTAALGESSSARLWQGASPLPPTALLTFAVPPEASAGMGGEGGPTNWSRVMFERLRAVEHVTRVSFNPMQMELAKSWVMLSQRVLWPLLTLLVLVVGLIVGNTIKLAQFSRHDEAEILKLVGSKNWYIQLPLLTGGAAQGFLGGVLSLGLLKLLQLGMQDAFAGPPLFLEVAYLPMEYLAGSIVLLTLVGMAASWIAVKEG